MVYFALAAVLFQLSYSQRTMAIKRVEQETFLTLQGARIESTRQQTLGARRNTDSLGPGDLRAGGKHGTKNLPCRREIPVRDPTRCFYERGRDEGQPIQRVLYRPYLKIPRGRFPQQFDNNTGQCLAAEGDEHANAWSHLRLQMRRNRIRKSSANSERHCDIDKCSHGLILTGSQDFGNRVTG